MSRAVTCGRKRTVTDRARTRNPENKDESAEMAAVADTTAKFHGRPPRLIRDVTQSERSRDKLADLGRLVELELRSGYALEFEKGTRVGYSPTGKQIYLVAGDQAIPAPDNRDLQDLGEVHAIVYATSKAFHNFEPTEYRHRFGEAGGQRPRLIYDCLNRRLALAGGTYKVTPRGIEN